MADWYRVKVKTECEMIVCVEAESHVQALDRARHGRYSPQTEWHPINYGHLRAIDPRLMDRPPSGV